MVQKESRFYVWRFGMEIGVSQGDPVSPTTPNILVDAVVREVLQEVCEPQEVQHVSGWAAREHNIVLYADNVRIEGRNPIWVHTTFTSKVRIF